MKADLLTPDRLKALRRAADVPHIYAKWQGAHWVLSILADFGHPPGDRSLAPMARRVVDAWLDPFYFREFEADRKADAYKKDGVPRMRGRYRRCASQQGNALRFLTKLKLISKADAARFVERLLHWQWPDGGWNCDRDPSADTSSFMETRFPMLGLWEHAKATGDRKAKKAALRAADVFLSRKLFRRRSDGRVIHPEFTKIHFPLYWHYDILGGLSSMADMGLVRDPRCADALELLESKRLPDGGWPAEARYYKVSTKVALGNDWVDWGGASRKHSNPFVTAQARAVLKAAGRAT